jgi:hypothetical protein
MAKSRTVDLLAPAVHREAEEPLADGEAQPASTGERWWPGRFAAAGINVAFALDRVEVVRPLQDDES